MNLRFSVSSSNMNGPGHKRVYFEDLDEDGEELDESSLLTDEVKRICKVDLDKEFNEYIETVIPMSEEDLHKRLIKAGFIPKYTVKDFQFEFEDSRTDDEDEFTIFFHSSDDSDNLRGQEIGEKLLRSCGIEPQEQSENSFGPLSLMDRETIRQELLWAGFTEYRGD
jgi:hypothetical protein